MNEIEKKKEKIKQLASQTPTLSRKQIADLCQVSAPYVTQVLGASRPYNKKIKEAA